MGILIGIVIAGFAYVRMQRAHMFSEQMADANKPVQTAPQKPPPPIKVPPPRFDFYTVLSKDEKVVAPASTTTKSNTNPADLLPPPATEGTATSESRSEQPKEQVSVTTVELPAEVPNREQMLVEEKQKLEQEIARIAEQELPGNTAPVENVRYVLSVGTFKDYATADEERAKLVLQGVEANIKKIQKNGQTLYRVWMGPYTSLKSAQQQQKRLQANLIKATLIKED
jgi:cell division protein FtsN